MQVTLSLKPAPLWREFTLRELRALQESLVREIVERKRFIEDIRKEKP